MAVSYCFLLKWPLRIIHPVYTLHQNVSCSQIVSRYDSFICDRLRLMSSRRDTQLRSAIQLEKCVVALAIWYIVMSAHAVVMCGLKMHLH